MNLFFCGLVLLGGFNSLWFFQPLQHHVLPFLSITSLLFGIYFYCIYQISLKVGQPRSRLIGMIFIFSLLFRFSLFPMKPTLSDDIYRYAWDGKVQAAGINPYQFAPADPALQFLKEEADRGINHPTVKTIYPPLSQWFFRIAYGLHPSLYSQKALFLIFDIFVLGLLIQLLRVKKRSALWALVYGWNPLCVIEFSTSGHNDSLMMFLCVLGLLLYELKKEKSFILSIALGVLSKWIPLILIPWLFVGRYRKYLLLFLAFVTVGIFPYFHHLTHWGGIHDFSKDWAFNSSVYHWISPFWENPTLRKLILGCLYTLFLFMWADRYRGNPMFYLGGALSALLVVSPVVHPWYVLWILPFLCFYPLPGLLLWTWLISFTYLVQIPYVQRGDWTLPGSVPVLEYGFVGLFLLIDFLKQRKNMLKGSVQWGDQDLKPVTSTNRRVSLIIPALNEEKGLPLVIQEIPAALVEEIIVVDNGSTDKTKEVARFAGARVVEEPQRGYGRAVLTGLKNINPESDTVVILDGDHSDFAEDLGQLLQSLEKDGADMVLGARTQAALPGSLMPQQKFGNWLTCGLIRLFWGPRYRDMGPFRAIRREALDRMNMEDENFGWNVEMQIKAIRLGMKVVEIPVRYRPRIGVSKISGTWRGSFKAGVIILWSLYRYGWRDIHPIVPSDT